MEEHVELQTGAVLVIMDRISNLYRVSLLDYVSAEYWPRCAGAGFHPFLVYSSTPEKSGYNRTIWSLVRSKEELLGVKVYGSRHPMSRRNGGHWGGKDPKRKTKQGGGGGTSLRRHEGVEVRHLDRGAVRV